MDHQKPRNFYWFDKLFGTRRFREFQSHYKLLALGYESQAAELLRVNRELAAKNKQIEGLQNEINSVRREYFEVTDRLSRLQREQPQPVQHPERHLAEKVARYGQQYRSGQIQSTPPDDSAILMATHIAVTQNVNGVYDDALERAQGYPGDLTVGNRRASVETHTLKVTPEQREQITGNALHQPSVGYREPMAETRGYREPMAETRHEAPAPSYTPSRHDDSPSTSDRSGGWGGGGDSGGDSGGGGGGGD